MEILMSILTKIINNFKVEKWLQEPSIVIVDDKIILLRINTSRKINYTNKLLVNIAKMSEKTAKMSKKTAKMSKKTAKMSNFCYFNFQDDIPFVLS